MTSVASGLFNHVYRNPPQVPSHLSPCAWRVEIDCSEDLLRSNDLLSVVRDNGFDGVIVGDPKAIVVLRLHFGHSPTKLRPATTTWNQRRSQIAECFTKLSSDSELTVGARLASSSETPCSFSIRASRCMSRNSLRPARSVSAYIRPECPRCAQPANARPVAEGSGPAAPYRQLGVSYSEVDGRSVAGSYGNGRLYREPVQLATPPTWVRCRGQAAWPPAP